MRFNVLIILLAACLGVTSAETSDYETVFQNGHTSSVTSVDVNSWNNMIVSEGSDATVKLWSLNTGILVRTFVGHKTGVKFW